MKNNPTHHYSLSQPLALLSGMNAEQFLAEYWQKKPLLIRQAIPGFSGLLSPDELAGLACESDVQSRLISHKKSGWKVENGPFDERRFAKLPPKDWTLLVQGVNHHLPEADQLLQQFRFVPHARLDDLMVSFAPDAGGVGAHFDSYDVFLLQGEGRRLWRISEQKDLALVEGVPLRILQNFQTEQEWVLEPGDMLYLPPHVAHWGIAVGACMTYSIGFRAPSAQELASEFLSFLQDKIKLTGMYADPDLPLQQHPAEIEQHMVQKVSNMLNAIRWEKEDIAEFIGRYLSEPKCHIVFDSPASVTLKVFRQRLAKKGIALSGKSQMLFHGNSFFLNGEQLSTLPAHHALWVELADDRQLASSRFTEELLNDAELIEQLLGWYQAGYVQFV
ncbi:cupin domain-containing protein [Methylobacillus caricis]|uniref:cupin domain-containing protein n=1 Tax=Methylobacillus caricis TaxID=1971611 RepID=UPI001CFF8925|nr:cupin domain-containing protein [Methylobacillus caricis]MCB5186950.1 cupin domain-containing protein [Methylobacillus caricis]